MKYRQEIRKDILKLSIVLPDKYINHISSYISTYIIIALPLALPTIATPLSTAEAATFLAVSTVLTNVSKKHSNDDKKYWLYNLKKGPRNYHIFMHTRHGIEKKKQIIEKLWKAKPVPI